MYRFGPFQVDPRTHELRKNGGARVKIQEQPFVVLLKLLERPGELVTRDELRTAIWPAGTFVDFDTGLNGVIKRLREALRDSVEVPLFIETVPKLGYRFIAPVECFEAQRAGSVPSPRRQRISARAKWVAVGTVLLGATAACYLLFQRSAAHGSYNSEIVPLTGTRGIESDPAFSPDGNQVAFTLFDDREGGRSGIYTTLIGGEKTLQLTNDPTDCCPVWSPDGRSIAFARVGPLVTVFYALPVLGGTPRKIYSIENSYKEHVGKPPKTSWSPDGRYLAISAPTALAPGLPRSRQAIALLSPTDSTPHPLTTPPPEFTDWCPAFAPDGKSIAFIRSSGPGLVDDIYVVAAAGGEPKRLTFDKRDIRDAPSWTADGREIIFSSFRGGLSALWRVSASGGVPRRVEGVGTSAFQPAIALKTERLAYQSVLVHVNLWMVLLRDSKHSAQHPQLLLATKGQASLPHFSPDGRKIAFESTQSGYDEIWTVNSDGSDPAQLTFLNGQSGTPHWSYDGRFIAFDYRPANHSEVYLMEVSGGLPRIVHTVPGADNTVPSWSHDGKWLYFSSNRGNETTQVWKVPYPAGGPAVQLTKNGGVSPIESADGFVYYPRTLYTDEIWKIPTSGGEETLVMKGTGLADCWSWALAPTGIYFMKGQTNGELLYYDFATRETSLVAHEKYGSTPTLAPDGKSIVFSQIDQEDQTIMLVNRFR
jgi:Tol biopolymer transport system component/DNA-binding winged helix-turn-helix (wHTH) protein